MPFGPPASLRGLTSWGSRKSRRRPLHRRRRHASRFSRPVRQRAVLDSSATRVGQCASLGTQRALALRLHPPPQRQHARNRLQAGFDAIAARLKAQDPTAEASFGATLQSGRRFQNGTDQTGIALLMGAVALRLANCLLERGQPVARPQNDAPARDLHPHRSRREPPAHDPPIAHRKRTAGHPGRPLRAGTGLDCRSCPPLGSPVKHSLVRCHRHRSHCPRLHRHAMLRSGNFIRNRSSLGRLKGQPVRNIKRRLARQQRRFRQTSRSSGHSRDSFSLHALHRSWTLTPKLMACRNREPRFQSRRRPNLPRRSTRAIFRRSRAALLPAGIRPTARVARRASRGPRPQPPHERRRSVHGHRH